MTMTTYNFQDTHSFILEETHDKHKVRCYFKAWGGTKSNDYDVPDDPVEVEVWGITVENPAGDEVRIDTFEFVEMWDMDWLEQYIYDNLSELTC